jgi:hypothetical protein
MRRNKHETVASLSVELRWASDGPVREYLDEIENRIHRLADQHNGVRPGVSSAGQAQGGTHWENFALYLDKRACLEDVAESMIVEMRQIGLRKNFSVVLRKVLLNADEDDVSLKKVLPRRNSRWLSEAETAAKRKPTASARLPQRVQYLEPYVRRYYLVGGNDVYSVFRRESELRQFLSSLPRREVTRLRDAYKRIVSARDHRWIMRWAAEDCGGFVSLAKAQVFYFLAFLDRLGEGGLLGAARNARRTRLVDWSLFV